MKLHLLFWSVILAAAFALAGCSNLSGYSAEYRAVHERVYWESLNGGGGTDGGAQAWANLRAHEAAEKAVGK